MQVLKFGGSSLANADNMAKAVEIVARAVEEDRTILVCSAIGGCTDALIDIGFKAAARDDGYKGIMANLRKRHSDIIRELLPVEKHEPMQDLCDDYFSQLENIVRGVFLLGELSPASLDAIQSFGELLSSNIMAARLSSLGVATKWVDAREVVRSMPSGLRNVVDQAVTGKAVKALVKANPIVSLFVFPGFIASDAQGRTTTLGRGGSDYSASVLAVASKARRLEIWTDVPGIMTANPSVVPGARTIRNISYRAALELSHFGAKVIYPPTIQPVVSEGIPIYVKDTFSPEDYGTLIEENPPRGAEPVMGITNSDNIALLSLEGSGMVGVPGFSGRLFDTLAREDINIILITQASSVQTMCIAVSEKDAARAKIAVDETFAYEISLGKINPLQVEKGFSIVCLVGDDIRSRSGATARMLEAMARRSVPVRATAQGSSERNISVIVSSSDVTEAIRAIHSEFFDGRAESTVNLFIAGYGSVGKALVEMIASQGDGIAARTGKRLKVTGLSNSRRFVIDTAGLDLARVDELLARGGGAVSDAYFEALSSLSLENSVFVDCTASSDISYKYINLFRSGYSVVACNKITFSAPYTQYEALRKAALEYHAELRFETTVGAALPILETISRCVNCGDAINKVEAVLSGTLNYIYSNYRGGSDGRTFADVVRCAQQAGYTEPDPRLDLSGRDVLRKLLILAREAGVPLDEADVQITPILGPEYFSARQEALYGLLEKDEQKFAAAYREAEGRGLRQRFVARLESTADGWKASMGVQEVSPGHPLYNLGGTDNCAIVTTELYPSPLVIQGAGAGARQTASGVLNDILLLG